MAAAPSYPTCMSFRIMVRTGSRVPEDLSLRRSDLRLGLKPPVISIRPEAPGSKARKGRERAMAALQPPRWRIRPSRTPDTRGCPRRCRRPSGPRNRWRRPRR